MVSKKILEKFKRLYQEKFNISLTDEETTQMATDLVNLMRVLLEPEDELNENKSEHTERRHDETIKAHPY